MLKLDSYSLGVCLFVVLDVLWGKGFEVKPSFYLLF